MTTEERLANALRVLVYTSMTREWLQENDPKALQQAVEALASLPNLECLWPEDHLYPHPRDFKFHVRMEGRVFWEDLTEAEIVERGVSFLHGSQWDFWWEG